MYTSLYKSNNVRMTQRYKGSSHRGVDLVCDDTLYAPVYLPSFLGDGEVWKITKGYVSPASGGKYFPDGRIIWVKHSNGMGQRFIHSRDKDIKVKVGDKIKVGDRICSQGASGYTTGVHLHYEVLKKYNDTGSHTDPMKYIDKETMNTYKKGDNIKIITSSKLNIRVLPDTSADVLSQTVSGAVGSILSNGVNADGYLWHFVKFNDVSGWIAVKWSEKTDSKITNANGSKVVDQTIALSKTITEKENTIKGLEEELDSLAEDLIALQLDNENINSDYARLESENCILKADLKTCKQSKIKEASDYELSELISAVIGKLIRIISGTIEE